MGLVTGIKHVICVANKRHIWESAHQVTLEKAKFMHETRHFTQKFLLLTGIQNDDHRTYTQPHTTTASAKERGRRMSSAWPSWHMVAYMALPTVQTFFSPVI